MAIRTYVEVAAEYDELGKITPLRITFRGRTYEVDQVLDVRQAYAVNAGGQGMRYTVRIGLRRTYLFQADDRRWFVEEKVPHEVSRVGGLVESEVRYRF